MKPAILQAVFSKERQLRKLAKAKGYRVRKMRSGPDQGRFLLIVADVDVAKASGVKEHPNSFTLEEAAAFLNE